MDDTEWSPLHMEAEYRNVAGTRALLAAGTNVTLHLEANGHAAKAPLDIAAHSGQVQVIREFARHGMHMDTYCDVSNWTVLDHAPQKNCAGTIDGLIEAEPGVTTTALDGATESLAVESMVTLLRHGALIRAAVVSGPYPTMNPHLHIAARLGGTRARRKRWNSS